MELLHITARTSVEWMLYCLLEGSLLALFAWVSLRLLPRQNAGTRFTLWFSVLLATILLPFLAGTFLRAAGNTGPQIGTKSHSLITFPDSVALAIFAVWALLAAVGLLRVIAGLWQVNGIRRNSEPVGVKTLPLELRASLDNFPRSVMLCVSNHLQVPAAIGFFKPAVVIPRWFLEEMSGAEIQQVVLHELTHLRRRDDWTNLAQKVIKAVLFFHPSVWWVEQQLALEREMACDDAVLAWSGSPQCYAKCLARLAEKSLMRKKVSLAQAAIGRMRQLSLRVARILDVNRPSSTRIWKPAIPMVMAAAALCGLSAWSAPELVSFQDSAQAAAVRQAQSGSAIGHEVQADLRLNRPQPKLILANASLERTTMPLAMKMQSAKTQHRSVAKATRTNSGSLAREITVAQLRQSVQTNGDYVFHSEQVVLTMSETGQPQMWQVSTWQLSVHVPADHQAGKTVSRKKI